MALVWGADGAVRVLNELYQQILERKVDRSGLITYGCILSRGEQTVRDIVRIVGHSQEYRDRFIAPLTIPDAVVACHRHFLGIDISNGGSGEFLQGWVQFAEKQGFDAVIDHLIDSDAYRLHFFNDFVPSPRPTGPFQPGTET